MITSPIPWRLSALGEILVARNLDALLITGPENRRYLSGFTAREEILGESCGMLLVSRESAYLSFRQYQRFLQEIPNMGLKFEWLPEEGLVESLREVKTEAEVAAMRRALTLTEGVFLEVAGILTPGITERQVAWEIEQRLRRAEADGLALAPIVRPRAKRRRT